MGNLESARGIERLSCFFQILADLLAAPKADMQLLSTRSESLHGVAGNVVGIRKALHVAFVDSERRSILTMLSSSMA